MSGTDDAVARRAFRQLRLGAGVWGLVFGATAAASALTYVSSFPDLASRSQLADTTSSASGLAILLGPVSAIDTVGGYTVYKCFAFLTVIGAIWALLATTRLLRGEEDAGRWQLVLAGDTGAGRATAATLAGLGAAIALLFLGATVVMLAVGRDGDIRFGVGETVLFGLSLVVVPAVFAAVGALASQLGRSRRVATGLGVGVFGATFVLRMVADSGPAARWLLWLTPFGWAELMRPFTDNDLRPLVPAGVAVAGICAAAAMLASRRDAGDGVFVSNDVTPARAFGLGSPLGLAARLELPVLVAWCAGAGATGFSFGIIAKVTTATVPGSLGDTLGRFGVHGRFADQYFGVAFLLVATLVALLGAGQVGAAFEEETTGRMVHLLARPVRRETVLGGRLALAGAGIVAASLFAGVAAWFGARTQGVALDLGAMVGAGLNVVPTALLALGIGSVALSVAARAAVAAVYGVVIGSLLVDLLASMVSGLRWAGHLSLFHYMALAPAQDVDRSTTATTLLFAAALCGLSVILFGRRDIRAG